MNQKNGKSVIVIGGGLGGISAAISCANRGYRVSLFEKNDTIGGKLNILKKNGFSFDLGPSILTLPHIFRKLFEEAGKNFDDYVDIVSLNTHWRNFFEDGTVIDLLADMQETKKHLEKKIPGSGKEFQRFIRYTKNQYDVIEKKYFNKGLDTAKSFFTSYSWIELFTKLDLFHTMNGSVSRFFTSRYLRDIFNYFIKYVGSSAYNAPGFMNLMPWVQFEYGLWYVNGGMYNLALGLKKLMEELGIALHCNAEVTRIITEPDRVSGIELHNGGKHNADYIISNMEVIPAYERLCSEDAAFLKKLNRFEPACSGLVLHLGVDKMYPQLAHHNFVYSNDQEKHFDLVFNRHKLPEDATIYLVAPKRTDPTVAPDGCDNLKILPHIPYLHEKNNYTIEDYNNLAERTIDKLEKIGLTDLRKHIIVKDMWTPLDIQKKYYSNKGSIYGVVSDMKKNFALKASKRSSKYNNLFFAGGSVNPGGGMPMVTLSGYNTAKLIHKEL